VRGYVCELRLKSVLYQNVICFTASRLNPNHSFPMSNFFTLPGEYAIKQLALHAPGLASLLGVNEAGASITFTIVLSLLIWVLGCVSFWGSIRLVQNFYRITGALVRTLWYRVTQAVGGLKTRLVCNFRQLFPLRHSDGQKTTPEVEFDDFDFTVLQAAASRGPGFTTSAPDLASQFGLRPSQFHKSLHKLHGSRMIATVIGSTDGFDNYRLTDYGAAYIEMWERRQTS